jgi:hypothetical protein
LPAVEQNSALRKVKAMWRSPYHNRRGKKL